MGHGSCVISGLLDLPAPEREVIADKLHDRGGVLILLLINLLNISNGIIEGHLRQHASLFRIILDLIMVDRIVEGKAEPDRMGGLELSLGLLEGCLVGLAGLIARLGVVLP
jgi:hypothetical protein